jgi:hypothetical protein
MGTLGLGNAFMFADCDAETVRVSVISVGRLHRNLVISCDVN